MAHIATVFHSGFGHTTTLAKAAARSASSMEHVVEGPGPVAQARSAVGRTGALTTPLATPRAQPRVTEVAG